MEEVAYIAVGSNLGDRQQTIRSAVEAIGALESTVVGQVSTLIETEPVGPGSQGTYLNGVIAVRTSIPAARLLKALLKIEQVHGRDRENEIRWGARTLDLDLLIYGRQQIDEIGLTIPHPRMHERSFVLVPLCEIAPDISVPGHEKTPREMLEALEGSR